MKMPNGFEAVVGEEKLRPGAITDEEWAEWNEYRRQGGTLELYDWIDARKPPSEDAYLTGLALYINYLLTIGARTDMTAQSQLADAIEQVETRGVAFKDEETGVVTVNRDLPHYELIRQGLPYKEIAATMEAARVDELLTLYEKNWKFYDWQVKQPGWEGYDIGKTVEYFAGMGKKQQDIAIEAYNASVALTGITELTPVDVETEYRRNTAFYDWLAKQSGLEGIDVRSLVKQVGTWEPTQLLRAKERYQATEGRTPQQEEDLARWGDVIATAPSSREAANLQNYITSMATMPPESRAQMEKWLAYKRELPSKQAQWSPYLREYITPERAQREPYLLKSVAEIQAKEEPRPYKAPIPRYYPSPEYAPITEAYRRELEGIPGGRQPDEIEYFEARFPSILRHYEAMLPRKAYPEYEILPGYTQPGGEEVILRPLAEEEARRGKGWAEYLKAEGEKLKRRYATEVTIPKVTYAMAQAEAKARAQESAARRYAPPILTVGR